ncbi:GNAT family N-acetyltransferase [Pontibacillus yanchengensis]|uniref:GNAT family acetyltransferase n=1 Tax=Pontibacillus yanchengensis Y32 TaxID=1385514 RepID=A0A0A2TED0_9BACI|nr:GNAT family N-acetyltransferase [Pontibacillus yanchengensis]KGP74207.1 GNAT family acetyltransferase [Pontibacillus yanchengensis Y32]
MEIKPLTREELTDVSYWLASLNQTDHHFIAWLESEQAAIEEQLSQLLSIDIPLAWVSKQDGEINGFIGVLPFMDQCLARLLGPFTTCSDAEQCLEALWEACLPTIKSHVSAVKVAFYKKNEKLTHFAEAHNFHCYNIEKTLLLHKDNWEIGEASTSGVEPFNAGDYREVHALHPSAAFYTLDEMIYLHQHDSHFHLWVYKDEQRVSGYVFLEEIEGTVEAEICFMNVAKQEQSQGIGFNLLTYACEHAFTNSNVELVTISVRNENSGAERLYKSYGFEEGPTIYAYEKVFS